MDLNYRDQGPAGIIEGQHGIALSYQEETPYSQSQEGKKCHGCGNCKGGQGDSGIESIAENVGREKSLCHGSS